MEKKFCTKSNEGSFAELIVEEREQEELCNLERVEDSTCGNKGKVKKSAKFLVSPRTKRLHLEKQGGRSRKLGKRRRDSSANKRSRPGIRGKNNCSEEMEPTRPDLLRTPLSLPLTPSTKKRLGQPIVKFKKLQVSPSKFQYYSVEGSKSKKTMQSHKCEINASPLASKTTSAKINADIEFSPSRRLLSKLIPRREEGESSCEGCNLTDNFHGEDYRSLYADSSQYTLNSAQEEKPIQKLVLKRLSGTTWAKKSEDADTAHEDSDEEIEDEDEDYDWEDGYEKEEPETTEEEDTTVEQNSSNPEMEMDESLYKYENEPSSPLSEDNKMAYAHRPMSKEEIKQLMTNIRHIPEDKLYNIINIILIAEPAYKEADIDEFEIDFGTLKFSTLWALDLYAKVCLVEQARAISPLSGEEDGER